uniref:Uncharacterized protein n=1 Tax=Nymphaea colorata TaxID=210225 RepID=A0A5K0WS90_9MAGN
MVIERVGKATYQLALLPQAEIYLVSHVTWLKLWFGEPPVEIRLLPKDSPQHRRIVLTRRIHRQDRWVNEVLVEWENSEDHFT